MPSCFRPFADSWTSIEPPECHLRLTGPGLVDSLGSDCSRYFRNSSFSFAPLRETLVVLRHCCGATVADCPGLRRTPALMARLAMWKAGDYLLPLPTLRLR